MVGLAGEGANFDGNGPYVRFAVGGGDQTISTGKVGGALGDTMFGRPTASRSAPVPRSRATARRTSRTEPLQEPEGAGPERREGRSAPMAARRPPAATAAIAKRAARSAASLEPSPSLEP